MGKEITRLDDLTLTSAREGPIHLRIKIIQHTTMIKLFSEIMEDYNISMIRYHEKCRLLLHQQKMLSMFSVEIVYHFHLNTTADYSYSSFSPKTYYERRIGKITRCSRKQLIC